MAAFPKHDIKSAWPDLECMLIACASPDRRMAARGGAAAGAHQLVGKGKAALAQSHQHGLCALLQHFAQPLPRRAGRKAHEVGIDALP